MIPLTVLWLCGQNPNWGLVAKSCSSQLSAGLTTCTRQLKLLFIVLKTRRMQTSIARDEEDFCSHVIPNVLVHSLLHYEHIWLHMLYGKCHKKKTGNYTDLCSFNQHVLYLCRSCTETQGKKVFPISSRLTHIYALRWLIWGLVCVEKIWFAK